MSEITSPIKRAVRGAAFTIGGGVALALAMGGTAHADTISSQSSDVTNAGVGIANSGGNVAVGNASTNAAGCAQGALGIIASNSCTAGNESNGSASITTGDATAVGNASTTGVEQGVSGDGSGPGLVVAAQDSDVTNAGLGVANSGLNGAVGNASTNLAGSAQGAVGGVASNASNASNKSNGTASIATGNANAVGNASTTKVAQAVDGDGAGPGLAVILQDSDVTNVGIGVANTGGNLALGNVSDNLALNLQGALGLVANNVGGASNASNGSASIKTGNASGIGNSSNTDVSQGAGADPAGLAVVVQSAPVLNAGLGIANSGLNLGVGNDSLSQAILAQVSFGLLANNVGTGGNLSDGFAMIVSGNASGIGNQSTTTTKQKV